MMPSTAFPGSYLIGIRYKALMRSLQRQSAKEYRLAGPIHVSRFGCTHILAPCPQSRIPGPAVQILDESTSPRPARSIPKPMGKCMENSAEQAAKKMQSIWHGRNWNNAKERGKQSPRKCALARRCMNWWGRLGGKPGVYDRKE